MRIGIISSHFSFPSINYLLTNKLVAGFAVPEVQNPSIQNIELLSETFNVQFNILHKNTLSEDLIGWLSEISADIIYIFSFPYKIPEKVLTIPGFGFINFHPGILPSYRGPDPIFWQLKNGMTETGITAYKLDKNIDTGPIIHIEKEQIVPLDTYGSLSKKLANTLLKSVVKVTGLLKNNSPENLNYINQDEKLSSYFGFPKQEDLLIDWNRQEAVSIFNLVRASNPKYLGAITFYKNMPLRLLQVSIQQTDSSSEPGVIIDSLNGIKVMTKDYKIISFDIISANEGYYTGKSFKNMFGIQSGDKFEKS